MKPSRLIVYFFVLASIVGYIYFVEHGYRQDRERQEKQSARFIPDDKDLITQIEISSPTIGKIELSKPSSDWVILNPIKAKADEYAVRSLITTITEASPERTISDNQVNWAEYGFESPALNVSVTIAGGKRYEMLFGAQNPSKSSYYLRLNDHSKLFLAADTLKTAMEKNTFDLRDKTIMSFAPSDIDRVIIQKMGVENEFRRDGVGQWDMVTPEKFRVKNVVISTLLRKLSNLTALEIHDDPQKTNELFGLTPPRDRISIFGKDLNLTLCVGAQIKAQNDSTVKRGDYVQIEGVETVYVVDDPSITDFKLDVDVLQDKSLISLNMLEIDTIGIALDGKNWLLKKSAEKKWNLEEPEKVAPIKDWSVTGILWKLRDLNYLSLVSPIPVNLDSLGLSEPKVVITLGGANSGATKILKMGWVKTAQTNETPDPKDEKIGDQSGPDTDKPSTEQGAAKIPDIINVIVDPTDYQNTIFQIDGSFVRGLSEDLDTLLNKQQ